MNEFEENEFLCYCCYNCPQDKRNLKEFNADDRELYKEFTGNDVIIETSRICVSCKESLKLSLEFLNLCKSSHVKFNQSSIKITAVHSNDIIFTTEESKDEEALDDMEIDEDDLPIASIKQQLDESEIYEVIEHTY